MEVGNWGVMTELALMCLVLRMGAASDPPDSSRLSPALVSAPSKESEEAVKPYATPPLAERSRHDSPPPAAEEAADSSTTVAPPSGDERRTNGRFLWNFGRNALGMFSVDNIKPLLVGAAATGLSTAFDDEAKRYFSATRRAKWLGDAVDLEGQPQIIVPVAAILFGAGRLSSHEHQRFRDATYDIAQATLVEAIYSTAIKYASQRQRPDGSNHLSFPSGHTSNAFAWATVGARHYGAKVGIPAYIVAALIGVGRMEKNVHYLSDVVAGATLGCLVGLTVTRRDAEPSRGGKRVRFHVEPSVPHGGGLGARASVEFR
jgi:membrane-associated phospholipid phosphatase